MSARPAQSYGSVMYPIDPTVDVRGHYVPVSPVVHHGNVDGEHVSSQTGGNHGQGEEVRTPARVFALTQHDAQASNVVATDK